MSAADPDAPVVLDRFTNLIDAEVVRSLLVSAGIRCELANAHLVGMMPHWSNAVGGVELHVRAADAELARKLLAGQSEPLEEPADPEPADSEPLLPSVRDAQATRAFRSAVLALFLLPVVLNVYSLWLLLRLRGLPGALSPRGRRHVWLAVVFNALLGWIPAALLLSGR